MSNQPIKLTVGGTVQANNGTYLKRPADDELFEACLDREFSYVLACRQIGKSSLMIATAERLQAKGIRVARIDLNRIGHDVKEAEDWYFSFLNELARHLRLETDVQAWWDNQPHLSTFPQRFVRFFDEVVLTEISQPVVIFIDEIDLTLGLPFTDDFFAAIRVIHNDRAQYPAYKGLTFVLLGVATPDELIKDNGRTPFNIGRAIPMRDFSLDECAPLRQAIEANHPSKSETYFQQIYDWTSGHPYLTQKLCAAVVDAAPTDDPKLVDNLVNTIFLADEERSDHNIRFVQNRILGDLYSQKMLKIYKQILQKKAIRDDSKSLVINRLKLYGIIKSFDKKIIVRNKIYLNIFDSYWLEQEMHKHNYKNSAIIINENFVIFYLFLFFLIFMPAILIDVYNNKIQSIYISIFIFFLILFPIVYSALAGEARSRLTRTKFKIVVDINIKNIFNN